MGDTFTITLGMRLSSRKTDNASWAGTQNYDEAYHLAKFGWAEGLEKLARQVEIAARLNPQNQVRRKKFDVAGISPHAGRAAAGDPFAMAARGSNFQQKPIIKVRVNFGYVGKTPTDTIMQWGAAICTYIRSLEMAGLSTQLEAFSESIPSGPYTNGPSVSFQFPLKIAGEPLSLSNVVFWWAHPSSLRRIEFSAMERLDIERWYSDGYGRPRIVTSPDADTLLLSIDDARATMEDCLKSIRDKHLQLLQSNPNPQLLAVIQPK